MKQTDYARTDWPSEELKAKWHNLFTRRSIMGHTYADFHRDKAKLDRKIAFLNSIRWWAAVVNVVAGVLAFAYLVLVVQFGWNKFVSPIGVPEVTFLHTLGAYMLWRFVLHGSISREELDKNAKKREAEKELLWLDRYRREAGVVLMQFCVNVVFHLLLWGIPAQTAA